MIITNFFMEGLIYEQRKGVSEDIIVRSLYHHDFPAAFDKILVC